MDSPALLGRRDARRRLPLRPRHHARAREPRDSTRSRSFFAVLRQDPVLSPRSSSSPSRGTWARAATRSAASRRAGRSGTTVPRHHARLLEGRRRPDRRLRAPAHRLLRPLRPQRPRPVRERQLHHRARRLHAARPRLLQRQAQRGERRGQPRRRRTTTCRGTAASRARPTTRRSSRCASARSATCSPRCCSRRACRCCWPATRSGRTQGGNNNAYCQDNEISWLDWNWDDAKWRLLDFTKRMVALRKRRIPILRRRDLLQGRPGRRATAARTSPGSSPTARR